VGWFALVVLLRVADFGLVVLVLTVVLAVAVPQLGNAAARLAPKLVFGTRSDVAVDVLVRLVTAVVFAVAQPDRRNAFVVFALEL